MSHSNDPSDCHKVRKADFDRAEAKPPSPPPRVEGIPLALRDREQWVCWQYEQRGDTHRQLKWTKVPIQGISGQAAKSTDSTTWAKFEEALAYYQSHRSTLDGIGYVFSADDPFTGIDLDDARDVETGSLFRWATAIVADLDTYTEVSPSGTGVKLIAIAQKPGTKCRKLFGTGELEMYSHGRFFTITGNRLAGTPAEVMERQEAVDNLYARVFGNGNDESAPRTADPGPRAGKASAADLTGEEIIRLASEAGNGEKFRRLFAGDISAHGSHSEADLALCSLLAFWVGPEPARIDALFRQSGLMRPKWDERHGEQTYGQLTIAKALEGRTEFYAGPGTSRATGRADGAHPSGQVRLGELVITPSTPHLTPSGKLTVPLTLTSSGQILDHITLTSSANGRKDAAKLITHHLQESESEPAATASVLASLIAWAVEQLERPPIAADYTLAELVRLKVPGALGLACRTDKGLWSETRGAELTRTELLGYLPPWLLNAGAAARDCPRDGNGVKRPALMRAVEGELKALFAELQEILPPRHESTLGTDTAAAAHFRAAMVLLWKAPRTFEVTKSLQGTNGEAVASRASLISRVRSQAKEYLAGNQAPRSREQWRDVQSAFSAWWRPYVVPGEGEVAVLLAMRWELTHQIGVVLPGVVDQPTLTALGRQLGVVESNPPVPGIMNRGTLRLAVLARSLTEELLAQPQEEEQPNADADPVTTAPE